MGSSLDAARPGPPVIDDAKARQWSLSIEDYVVVMMCVLSEGLELTGVETPDQRMSYFTDRVRAYAASIHTARASAARDETRRHLQSEMRQVLSKFDTIAEPNQKDFAAKRALESLLANMTR